jgi:carbonic anhydrase/acetyltransferase-like protein (isoleucine patch superfamily)
VGAKALISEDKVIPSRSLVLGVPGRVVRSLTEQDIATVHDITARYITNSERHRTMILRHGSTVGWSTSEGSMG